MKIVSVILLLFSISSFGQDSTSHSSDWLIKMGISGKGNTVSEVGNIAAVFGAEVALGDNFSINAAFDAQANATLNTNYTPVFLEGRCFLDKDRLSPFNGIQTTNNILSGAYISAGVNLMRLRPFEDFVNRAEIDNRRNSENILSPNYGINVKLGRQYWGLLDFGVSAGFDAATEKVSFYAPEDGFILKKNNVIGVSSYFKFHLPFAGFKKRIIYKPNCDVIECATEYKQLLKFGLQDVFNFSNAGIYFRPEIGYERPLGKSGLAFNVSAELQFSRRKAFEIEGYRYNVTGGSRTDSLLNRISIFSERPYLHQSLKFSVDPQLRWYFLQKRDLAKGKSVGPLEGFFFSADATLATGSLEVFRDAWSFDRGSAAAFGGGAGYQKLLFQKVLAEASLSFLYGNSWELPGENGWQRKGGLKFYWVK